MRNRKKKKKKFKKSAHRLHSGANGPGSGRLATERGLLLRGADLLRHLRRQEGGHRGRRRVHHHRRRPRARFRAAAWACMRRCQFRGCDCLCVTIGSRRVRGCTVTRNCIERRTWRERQRRSVWACAWRLQIHSRCGRPGWAAAEAPPASGCDASRSRSSVSSITSARLLLSSRHSSLLPSSCSSSSTCRHKRHAGVSRPANEEHVKDWHVPSRQPAAGRSCTHLLPLSPILLEVAPQLLGGLRVHCARTRAIVVRTVFKLNVKRMSDTKVRWHRVNGMQQSRCRNGSGEAVRVAEDASQG